MASLLFALALSSSLLAQKDEDADLGPLFQQPPHDRVVLKSGESLEVQTLRFQGSGRKVPSPFPLAGSLDVRLYESKNAAAVYQVPWNAIVRIDLFEDLVLQEAQQLTQKGKFDEAYGFLGHLLRVAPKTRGLDAEVHRYLQANAGAAFQAGEFDRALAILGGLYERAPQAKGLERAVDVVAGKIIEQYLQEAKFRSARMTLDVVERNFQGLPVTVVSKWRQQFEQSARKKMAEAKQLAESHNYLAARQALSQAIGVWPESAGALELQTRIQREHPIVRVGVAERAPLRPTERLDSWASSRVAGLVRPTLVELRDYSTDGGVYRSSVAQIDIDDSARGLTIMLADPPSGDWLSTGLGASSLVRLLMAVTDRSNPTYQPLLADLLQQIDLEIPSKVRIVLTRPHVRPEALLTFPLPAELIAISDRGRYDQVENESENHAAVVRFVAQGTKHRAIAEIHEVPMANDDDAVAALIRGQIDVIDRVPPWQLSRLRAAPGVTVDSYRLPTLHAIVPTGRSPLTSEREFRRAVGYGVDRVRIVRDVLLAGGEERGFQVISGPFPAGVSLDDPIRRGYNSQIKPRVYDPYIAIVLASAAWASAQKRGGVQEPSETLPTLQLGHSADPIARTTCLDIAKSLSAIDIPIELVELSTEELLDAKDKVDLKYVELAVWEPVIDARRLLGSGGLLGETSDFMSVALDRLDKARNWNEATSQLFEIHDVTHSDLPLLPLWQTINYFAYRNEVRGISERPIRLYQDIGHWQIEFRSEQP